MDRKVSLLNVAIILAICSGSLMQKTNRTKDKAKVLILGTGMAGISAAKTLADLGETDFIIIEGSDRIGGRIKDVPLGNYRVEIGAQWISGGGPGDPIYEMAQKLNMTFRPSCDEDYTYRSNSIYHVIGQTDKRCELFDPELDGIQENSTEIETNGQSSHWLRRRKDWVPHNAVDYVLEYWSLNSSYAVPSEGSSRRTTFPKYEQEYTEYTVTDQGGFAQIVTNLAEKFLKGNDTRMIFNQRVIKIIHTDDEVVIETADGSTYSGEHVIVTFSLGVLQKPGAVIFEPKLPDWKLDSIAQFTFTLYLDVYVIFDAAVTPFWDPTEWTLLDNERRGYYPAFLNFNTYLSGSNILEFTVTGDEANRIKELSDETIKAELQEFLRQVYGSSVPDIKEIVVSRFATDPLYYGMYSDWPVGYTDESHDALKASIGRLHFAGEAYDRKWYGYVNGAYHSGQDRAMELYTCMEDMDGCDVYNFSKEDL